MNYQTYLFKSLPIFYSSFLKKDFFFYCSSKKIFSIIFFLKYHTHCQYQMLSDLCGVDYPSRKKRFEIIYHLLSVHYNSRIGVKTQLHELETTSSITPIYPSASWWEREVWDLFGIFFSNHSDLRRILTDYGFEGHPLRKDFPLTGYLEVYYNEFYKNVLYKKASFSQQYRFFNFQN